MKGSYCQTTRKYIINIHIIYLELLFSTVRDIHTHTHVWCGCRYILYACLTYRINDRIGEQKTFFLLWIWGHTVQCVHSESEYLINEFMNVTGEKWWQERKGGGSDHQPGWRRVRARSCRCLPGYSVRPATCRNMEVTILLPGHTMNPATCRNMEIL